MERTNDNEKQGPGPVPALISVIVLSWNSERYLGACLDSVKRQTHFARKTLVIDNGSRDGSVELVRRGYPEVRLIVQEKNVGFARGNNIGIAQSAGEFVMTLNSDVVLEPNYIELVLKAFDAGGDRLGMACGKLRRPGGRMLDSTGVILTKLRRFQDRGSEEEDRGQYDGSTDIFGPCAAAAIFRRRMLEEIRHGDEYFDEDFFAYVEDVDLAWRARRHGWTARFVPDAAATHIRGASNLNRRYKQALSFRNRYWMILKNDTLGAVLRDLPLLVLYDLPRFLFMCLTNPRTLPYTAECLYKIPKMIRKRTPSKFSS